jgi:hypothetical protein
MDKAKESNSKESNVKENVSKAEKEAATSEKATKNSKGEKGLRDDHMPLKKDGARVKKDVHARKSHVSSTHNRIASKLEIRVQSKVTRLGEFSPIVLLFTLVSCLKMTKDCHGLLFTQ